MRPLFFLPALFLIIAVTCYALFELHDRKITARMKTIAGTQILLIVSAFLFLLFTERAIPRHIIALSLGALLALIIEQLRFLRFANIDKSSGDISGTIMLSYAATLFWAGAAFYGFRIFFQAPLFPLAVFIFLISLFFNRSILASIRNPLPDINFRAIIIAVLAFELFLTVYAAPSYIAVSGAFFAIPIATFVNIYRLRLEDRLGEKMLSRNLFFAFFALIIVAATAKWR